MYCINLKDFALIYNGLVRLRRMDSNHALELLYVLNRAHLATARVIDNAAICESSPSRFVFEMYRLSEHVHSLLTLHCALEQLQDSIIPWLVTVDSREARNSLDAVMEDIRADYQRVHGDDLDCVLAAMKRDRRPEPHRAISVSFEGKYAAVN